MIRQRVWLACVALLVGCGRPAAPARKASPPLNLAGQRVLVLPVQGAAAQDSISDVVLGSLRAGEPAATWIGPSELRRALARAPGYAADPRTLPADPLLHHGDRRAADPLAGQLRRLAALVDARLALLPREARFVNASSRVTAALLDTRTGVVLWTGDADDAAALATRLVGHAP